jgi:hypothetical protein
MVVREKKRRVRGMPLSDGGGGISPLRGKMEQVLVCTLRKLRLVEIQAKASTPMLS